ncbi:hypothetical protein [Mucilaginibacter sp. dw_454]|nr:hypothetical protein [Mucilaginibacter sp. dw_454]
MSGSLFVFMDNNYTVNFLTANISIRVMIRVTDISSKDDFGHY